MLPALCTSPGQARCRAQINTGYEKALRHQINVFRAGTHEEVQELRAQMEEEAEMSAQAFERVQTAEAELTQLRSEYTALQVRV